ncbi:hypothetical protein L1987_34718 [Smallanthus sonchifolius]|uniref:Uncharacterized protein n=1 Tax=Smallanthus sonchifolius TaxID=185202 RepID=A0ACB9HW20_9ASTR|nr:hypothetical protein L1987_34718 [Smallanthus sonchifolius]
MNSDIPHHNQQNTNSGLTRYRSAPSSYFSNLINTGMYGDQDLDSFFNPILPRFVSNDEEFMKQEQLHTMYQNPIVSSSASAMDPPTNILRQSSSPAGFLENGYPMEKLLSRIPENNGGFWDESSMLADGYLNEFVERYQISSSENKGKKLNDGGRIQSVHAPSGLSHQLSLPTSSTELSVKERLLQVQDNVPLRSRAKRGCATHPRSIAERVRRTRISERMRKLQDLVPNMDKQTSTADMLDLAVDYIKELQNQVETLSTRRKKCTCQNKLKP